jgi:hypothetical protein
MRKSRFTGEQIIKVLKEHAAGLSAGDLCRKYGISDATFYIYGLLGRTPNEIGKLRILDPACGSESLFHCRHRDWLIGLLSTAWYTGERGLRSPLGRGRPAKEEFRSKKTRLPPCTSGAHCDNCYIIPRYATKPE